MHIQAVFIPFIFARVEGKGKTLIIGDNKDVLFALNLLLEPYMQKAKVTTQPARIEYFTRAFQPDVVLLDINFHRDAVNGREGLEYLGQILETDPQAVMIFMTAYSDIGKAVKAIKVGATDFISKPWEAEKLLATLSSDIRLSHPRKEVGCLREQVKAMKEDDTSSELIGKSPAILEAEDTIYKLVKTDANILTTGESGTGKDLVARLLGHYSPRRDDAFMTTDLGSIPKQLFESELFGHEKGAFTDARRSKPGRVEMASGGTLFLDEIGNLSLPMQSKLLTAIEKRHITRLGAVEPISTDVCLICTTNANLRQLVGEGGFWQDLFYRINTIEIAIPPLRERGEDILMLADHFRRLYSRKYKKTIKGLSREAGSKLMKYPWSGNVRELQHVSERAVILNEGTVLRPDDFPLYTASYERKKELSPGLNLEQTERKIIERALWQSNGNMSYAAGLLGITRFSLYRRIEKFGLRDRMRSWSSRIS